MTVDLISLATICIVAFLCPLIVQSIPGRPLSETVFLLIVGAILGPYLIGWIQTTASISLLSDLGLAFLFLLAGYEINPHNLTGHEGKRGLVTWFLTLALAFLVVVVWPTFSARHIDGIAVAIALTTTALGTLLPILQERHLLNTRIGDSVLAYGTWGELCPVIAMTLLLSTRASWQTILILIGFIAIAVIAGVIPKHARMAGSKLFGFIERNANTNSQMMVRGVVMLLVCLTALSAIFKLDIVLGAFAAGFVLRYIIVDDNPILETKLTSLSYGFFIPLFFIVSGAKIDMSAIAEQPLLLIEFIVLLLFVRTLPIFIALTTDKESEPLTINERITVALYCTTALPLIVAVTTVAVNAGAMSQTTASVLVAAGGITVLIMPILAQLVMRTINAQPLQAAKQIAANPKATPAIIRKHRDLERSMYQQERDLRRKHLREAAIARGKQLGLTDHQISQLIINSKNYDTNTAVTSSHNIASDTTNDDR